MVKNKLVLRTTTTSPFGRKVRMAIEVLGLTDRVVRQDANTLDENDPLRKQNPLGKMPVLLLADGTPIYDSGVIVEYLQEIAGSKKLVPLRGIERYKALTRATLADGIAEAALLMVYEYRFRPAEMMKSERWLAHQRGKIFRALDAFEAVPPPAGVTDIVSIALACALSYLDWRKPVEWRSRHPRLVKWLADFSAHEPSFARTAAEEPA